MIDMTASGVAIETEVTDAIATIVIAIGRRGTTETTTTAAIDGTDIPGEVAVVEVDTRTISETDATSTIDTIVIAVAIVIARISETTTGIVTTDDHRHAIAREDPATIKLGRSLDPEVDLPLRILCHLLKPHPQSLSQPTFPPDLVPV